MKSPPLRHALAALAVLVVTDAAVLAVTQAILAPPLRDLIDLGAFLLLSGSVALGFGSAVPLLARRGLVRSVGLQLVLIPVVVVFLTLVNVMFIGHLMFVSPHDLGLLTVVLLFALVLAVVLAVILSEAMRRDIRTLAEAVGDLSVGNLRARAAVTTRDELGTLATTLNDMAARLEDAFTRQQDLERARREMVVAVSHDLRTPLSSMRAIAESINDGVVTDPETVRRYLRTIEAEVARLSTLIDDLFELSQIDAGALKLEREPASLRDLVSDTIGAMSAAAHQRGLQIAGDVDETLPLVDIDARRIQRVLSNLVQNALAHTTRGEVRVHARAAGNEVEVQVMDTGVGIAAADLPRVFEPFYRGDSARRQQGGGAGVGLSIVKALVEAHGGRVWAQSTPGSGSVFTFTVPRAS